MVSMGVLKWVECTVMEPSYFKLNTDHTPLHLILLDEVRTLVNVYCIDSLGVSSKQTLQFIILPSNRSWTRPLSP